MSTAELHHERHKFHKADDGACCDCDENDFIVSRTRLAEAKAASPSVIGEIAQKVS